MAKVYAQNVVEIAVRATLQGRPHVNVFHMFNEESSTVSDETIVSDFATNWQEHILDKLHTGYKLISFDWYSMDPDDNNSGSFSPHAALPVAGAVVNSPLPPNVAVLVKKNTANRPRGKRDGRMFLGGQNETTVDEFGNLTPAEVDSWNTVLGAFYNGIEDTSAAGTERYPVVLETTPESRAPGAAPVIIGSRKVSSMTVDPRVSTQRDRLR